MQHFNMNMFKNPD